jgi:transcriptional regulator with XRE-family HTH domain
MAGSALTVTEKMGRNLSRLRREAGISQGEIGQRAGLHSTAIGLIERGQRKAQVDTLIRLAGALEVEPGDLLAGIEWKPPAPQHGHFEITDDDATL